MLERVWKRGDPLALLLGMWIGTTAKETNMEVPQNTKYRITIWSSNPTSGYIFRQPFIEKDTCAPRFIAALFTIAKTLKQPNCLSTDEWIKMCHIYIYVYIYRCAIYIYIYIECYTKRSKIMPFAVTWMELESLILTEVSQKDKDRYHMISLICRI